MRSVALSLTLVAITAAPAPAAERRFDVSGFTEVVVGDGLTVEVVAGDGFAVIGEGAPRDLRRLEITRRGEVLVIGQEARGLERFSPLMWALADEVIVRVTLPELRAVEASAGSDVTVLGSAADALRAAVRAGADLEIADIDTEAVMLAAASGGRLEAAGRCGALSAEAGSGAGLNARGLMCDSAEARASAGAQIEVTAEKVRAEAQAGAAVEVWGAVQVEADEQSGGDVRVHD